MVICRLEPVKRDVDRPAICRPMEMLGTVEPLQNAAGVHIPLGPMQVQDLDVIGRCLLPFCFAGRAAFEKGKELIVADMIRNAGIREDMMSVTSRIAIMRPGVNRELLNGCGIRFFCVVDDDYNLEVTEQVPDQEVWDGVPIVK